MRRDRVRADSGTVGRGRSRCGMLAVVAALVATFALALPAGASAANVGLTVKIVGAGTVQCEVAGTGIAGACASSYPNETELVLYAKPSEGSIFVRWADKYCSFYEAEPCELTIEEKTTVIAEFGPIPKYPLTIEMEGSGTGAVECKVGSGSAGPCGSVYPA